MGPVSRISSIFPNCPLSYEFYCSFEFTPRWGPNRDGIFRTKDVGRKYSCFRYGAGYTLLLNEGMMQINNFTRSPSGREGCIFRYLLRIVWPSACMGELMRVACELYGPAHVWESLCELRRGCLAMSCAERFVEL